MVLIGVCIEVVIIGDFFTFLNGLDCGNPDAVSRVVGFAVGVTGVVDQLGVATPDQAVDVPSAVEGEHVDGAVVGVTVLSLCGLFFGDQFSGVFDNAGSFTDVFSGKNAAVMNPGIFNFDVLGGTLVRCLAPLLCECYSCLLV